MSPRYYRLFLTTVLFIALLGCVHATGLSIAADNPIPALTGLSPNTLPAGSAAFTLTVNGTDFIDGSIIRWNGANRRTTFVSATQLTAAIPAGDVLNPGTISVTVLTPAPGGGTSNTENFTITPANNPLPTINGLNPNSAVVGGGEFTLTVTGTDFVNGTLVRWNGQDRPTDVVSATQLTAIISAGDIAAQGIANVTVINPLPGGGISNVLSFPINPVNPAPALAGISPTQTLFGGSGFTLTVNGSNFVSNSVVRWKGSDRETTFVSETQLTAVILPADIASAGTAAVTVFNPEPGGGVSGALNFTINSANPAPALTALSPSIVPAGAGTFTLTVTGSGFISTSVIRWNGANRRTTFVSETQLTTSIPASLVTIAGTASVTVSNPAPGGGVSNGLNFVISENNPPPVLSFLDPESAIAGSGDFTLTVNGNNFVSGAVVRWNGQDRPTTFVSHTQLTAMIPATDLATVGSVSITVFNPEPGGGVSGALNFAVNPPPNPIPTLGSLSPVSVSTGSDEFTLSVTGTNFINGSVVRWNGSDRQTTFVSATQLKALIPDTDLGFPNTAAVTVFTPAPGGGISNTLSFIVAGGNPVPTLTSLSPASAPTGGSSFTLTVTGLGFVNGAIIKWNNASLRTTFVSSTHLTAVVPNSNLTSAGQASVAVFNPQPDGGTSNALPFTISSSTNPVPALTVVSPNSVTTGIGAFTLTVTGTNFVNGAVVRWNGNDRVTTCVSSTQLTAAITANDVAVSGDALVSVFNPAPGGGVSNASPVVVTGQLASVSAAGYSGGSLATESIVAAFGSHLSTGTQGTTAIPLPTGLTGTSVTVRDSIGTERLAPLFFVSPTQINYQIPPGTAPGNATVTVTASDSEISSGTVGIVAVAPGLFSADASGQGVAGAVALRVRSNGSQQFEPVFSYDESQARMTAVPIDLGQQGDDVYLILFGTGFRARSDVNAVTVRIGDKDLSVTYAGAQGAFIGLDQINVKLPPTLIGKGELDVMIKVDGQNSNTVKVRIK
ncbi:MAG TPA: hypothetical protein VFD58_02650 [Blastocatellia bacterium]|nr:hypothetical protein [Blastocatellia bacterium]